MVPLAVAKPKDRSNAAAGKTKAMQQRPIVWVAIVGTRILKTPEALAWVTRALERKLMELALQRPGKKIGVVECGGSGVNHAAAVVVKENEGRYAHHRFSPSCELRTIEGLQRRNREMLQEADYLLAFPTRCSRITRHAIREALKQRLPCEVCELPEKPVKHWKEAWTRKCSGFTCIPGLIYISDFCDAQEARELKKTYPDTMQDAMIALHPRIVAEAQNHIKTVKVDAFDSITIEKILGTMQDPRCEGGETCGEVLAILSLGSKVTMHFTSVKYPDVSYSFLLTPGSLLILCGDARHLWARSIPAPPSRKPHYSITFYTAA